MKRTLTAILCAATLFLAVEGVAHPGSGIVVDKAGNVYFVDTGSGVWKLGRDGKLTKLPGPAYHWMTIDAGDRLKNVTLPRIPSGDVTVTRVDQGPTLILSSDVPVAVGPDGTLFYPLTRDEKLLQVFRLDTAGKTTAFATLSATAENTTLRWVNGAAVGPDGSFYYTEDAAVRKITPRGENTIIAAKVSVSGCASIPGMDPGDGPYLRGLDVDAEGAVYVAAAGCGAVLKIAPDGTVTTVLRSTSPWSPTGVAVYGKDLYVLEYYHTVGDNRREWVPRVRKVAADASITTVATIDRK